MNEDALRDYLRKAVKDLQRTRQRLRDLEAKPNEPIAIIGMACRYPGGIESPRELWDAVSSRRDLIREWPSNRGWDRLIQQGLGPVGFGGVRSRSGGFLSNADEFDAEFFGIGADEAVAMDPLHRQVLEVSWEAIEHARIDPQALHGSDTGVYLGAGNDQGYGSLQLQDVSSEATKGTEGHHLIGGVPALASGRVSYCLGLKGPSLSLDTACSSGLVAVHLAVQALRTGDCSMALAGGGSILSTPGVFSLFDGGAGLAADGKVKPFAANADGTNFAEGVGILLLERLSDARRLEHNVLAVVRGSAVNQDGASNGLLAPSGLSQQQVIRSALGNASVSAVDVDVIEAHGTGTALGDMIEARALAATYGRNRSVERPLMVGSIKSNIGHTQLASGVAGVIKMVEAMRAEMLPATINSPEPDPELDWAAAGLKLVVEEQQWPTVEGRPRRAGVSSFGISGTNSHVIVEQLAASEGVDVAESSVSVVPWIISAKSSRALAGQAATLLEHVGRSPRPNLVDVGFSLVSTRSVFEYRAVVWGCTVDELVGGLSALADGTASPRVLVGRAAGDPTGSRCDGADAVSTPMGVIASRWVNGGSADWFAFFAAGRTVGLPTYAFQRRRYWPAIDVAAPGMHGKSISAGRVR